MSNLTQIFNEYKEDPIALYGLGTETERVLSEIGNEFQIVGLLDGFREEGSIYGKNIIPLSQCIKDHVKLIIVVARPGSCRAISKRIGHFCVENHIALIDVRGKNLCAQNQITYDFQNVQGITKEKLAELVSGKDAVSFDLFDTLIMRQVLFPSDVIELTNLKLKEKNICIENFCEKRQQAEKELSRDSAPKLEEIYQFVLDQSPMVDIRAKELAELEWSVDYQLVVPRKEMVAFARNIYERGKKVYIVTDTYYGKEQIELLLTKCGVTDYTDILVSCEYKMSKTQGLFQRLKSMTQGYKCLHIGDDLVADIESARECEISACQIYNSLDLLEMVGYLGLSNYMDNLYLRVKIGMFAANIFNSPFQFETKDKKLCVSDAYDIGYLFIAPMLADFTVWFNQKIKEEKVPNVWMGARDGYLMKKLYDMLNDGDMSAYFLTSRMAAIRAGIESEKDIDYIAAMKFSGTLEQQLKERFDIEVSDATGKSLRDFYDIIKEKAVVHKENYQRYIKQLGLKEGNIAFFDFVAKGTTQLYISRLVDNHIRGLYFLQLEKDYMQDKHLDIIPFYESEELENSAIYEDYYILETILTSDKPSVVGFSESGSPVYAYESRAKQDIICVSKIQEGITDYFRMYIQICPDLVNSINKNMDEVYLSLLHKIQIGCNEFLKLKVEDTFFNRMTNMMDLI